MLINNIDETIELAKNIAKESKPGDIYCLVGDLASGKTVFCKNFIKYYIDIDNVVSPTFNIIKTYNVNNNQVKNINHFDVYRIKSLDELNDIGFYDYIYDENSINLIEWADLIKDAIPKNAKWIKFYKYNQDINKREIIIE